MTPSAAGEYSEDALVEQPAIALLDQLGWETYNAFDEFGQGGRTAVDKNVQSELPWFFVGGDIIEGPDVIHGIANGHKAAIGIDNFLKDK